MFLYQLLVVFNPMKMFSIIVPCHNGDKYICRCLDSILKQSYNNYEIIFINDCSEDFTQKIITEHYCDSRINYFYVDFKDLSKVKNYGVTKVKGDYIIFLDIDDWIENELLQKLSVQDNINDMIRYQSIMVDDNNNNIHETFITNDFFDLNGNTVLNLFAKNYEIFSPSWLYAYKLDFWLKNNFKFPDGKLQEDFALTSLILNKAEHITSIPYIGHRYYKSQNSIMRNNNQMITIKRAMDVMTHCDMFYEQIINESYNIEFRKNLINYYLNVLTKKLNTLEGIYKEEYAKQISLRKQRWR